MLRGQAQRRQVSGQARVFAREVLELDVAVPPLLARREADHQLVGHDGPVDRPLDVEAAVVARGRFHVSAVGVVRLLGEDPDGAAHRVAPVEHALRAALDLDAIDVQQVEDRSERRRVIDVVDIEADPRLEGEAEVRLADTADEREIGVAEAAAALGQADVRRRLGDIQDVGVAAVLELRGVDRRDRQRRLLQVLRPELCGDHDLLKRGALGRRSGGRLGRRAGVLLRLGPCVPLLSLRLGRRSNGGGGSIGFLGHGEARDADGAHDQGCGQGRGDRSGGGVVPQSSTAGPPRFELLISHDFLSPVSAARQACGRRPARPWRGLFV